ncbi:MAG TPA: deoxyribose-phosphate aldolase [bacterium]|nr:deoxyribose-phosphate aldolase [bacterium]HPN42816.1 deoxyribose-phosphate aldolase [bacterium]
MTRQHSIPGSSQQLASMIDHTLLKPEATRQQIEQLCREAIQFGFATVCVNPTWVKIAADLVHNSTVKVCSVIGFPLGANTQCLKVDEAKRAVADGAQEIDMVMNIGRFKSGDLDFVFTDIRRVLEAIKPAHLKVIIETCLLTDEDKVAACIVAQQAGAHFVKTSTGFANGGATGSDVALMRRVVGDSLGVKAAGGIRDRQTALAMIRAGASRIGASAGVAIINEKI